MKGYSYNEHKTLKKSNVSLCRILLALLLLFVLSNVAVDRALYQGFFDVLNNPLLVFILMNFIIVALCFLTTQTQTQPTYNVVYHEIDENGSNCGGPDVADALPYDEEHMEEENIPVDKHIILVENAVGELVAVSSGEGSESFKRNHHHHELLELRKLERRMSKDLVITMREPPWRSSPMDDMSNEEFRLAIEAFISQRSKVMIEENVHDEETMHFLISTSH